MPRSAVLGAGILVGLWHLWIAAQAIFVFRTGEPFASWVIILLGPASTLLAVLSALVSRHIAGYWLLAGGLASLVIFAVYASSGATESVYFALRISGPMALIGAFILQSSTE
jgi:hypothetical protein